MNLLELIIGRTAMAESWIDGAYPQEDISTFGHKIDYLFGYTTNMNIFFFVLVCMGLIGFSFMYHHKKNAKPYYTHGNKKAHLTFTLIVGLSVFLLIDLNITRMSNDDMIDTFWKFPSESEDHVKVEVLAQQWMWNFRYPGADGRFNTEDDILSNHELHLPVNKKVEFRIASKDVIHSFYLPNARLKVDAIPGRITRLWFEPTKTGEYEIACAEMCGTHHYLMKAKLIIHSEEDFNNWKNTAQELAQQSNDIENEDFYWGWPWKTAGK